MYKKQMLQALAAASNEKDVENTYRAAITAHAPQVVWQSPHNTDGLAVWKPGLQPKTVRLLLEAKFDQDFQNTAAVCNVLGQMILYLKRFELAGDEMPNVLFVGDRNECFAISTSVVQNFLNMKIDWTVAPSKGSPALVQALVQGLNILPFVEKINQDFDFQNTLGRIEILAQGFKHAVKATEQNLSAMFLHWQDQIFRKPDGKVEKRAPLTATEQVGVFLDALFRPNDVYLHPQLFNVLVAPGFANGVPVDAKKYKAFFNHFAQGYKPSEKNKLYAMKDRLIEDKARREQGAFFTPRLWVDEAHKEIEAVLGPDWRRDCVVWDPAAGTANLTRDYHDWGCLISSTCEASDVATMAHERWGGEVFQYDYLNPDGPSLFLKPDELNVIPPRVEKLLREGAAAGKRLVFFMNPPYAEDGVAGAEGATKKGVALTKVNQSMDKNFGRAGRQLYAQFMFQSTQLAKQLGYTEDKVVVAQFSMPKFLSSGSYRPFREWWLNHYDFGRAFMFQASHFADVSGAWGVFFSVWKSKTAMGTAKNISLGREFPVTLKDVDDFTVTDIGVKTIYNSDDKEASEWVEKTQKGGVGDTPKFSSGLKVVEKWDGGSVPGSVGVMASMGNNLVDSATGTMYLSGKPTHKGRRHFDLLPSNWRRAVALYGARKLVRDNWVIHEDEYLVPDESLPGYDQWVDDLHVYALLESKNNCTAMRDVQYKGKSWRIKNHWFWKTRKEMIDLLDTSETPALHHDALAEPLDKSTAWGTDGDPYFAHLLATGLRGRLSPDVKELLGQLDELFVRSLVHRERFAAGREELHLGSWDAGIYQLKDFWQEVFDADNMTFHYKEDYKKLRECFHKVAERLREGVYTYGFLRK
jgi:hypothetical protein